MQHTEGRNFSLSVGQIQFFIKHNSGVRGDHIFACIHWYKKHSNYDYYGSSCIVCKTEFETDLSYCFIPIQRISSLCVHGNIELKVVSSEFYFHKPIPVHIELYLFYCFIHF